MEAEIPALQKKIAGEEKFLDKKINELEDE